MTREPIYAALFALLQTAIGKAGVVTVKRGFKHFDDVNAADQPAVFMSQRAEVGAPQPRGMPSKWTLQVEVYIYARNDDTSLIAATPINNILDAITSALAAPIDGVQTLGGLVAHCWIEGAIQIDEGTFGQQGVAIVPIHMLAT